MEWETHEPKCGVHIYILNLIFELFLYKCGPRISTQRVSHSMASLIFLFWKIMIFID